MRDAVAARGRAAVAFSGGTTPNPMLAALAGDDLPWSALHIYQVDERVAPDGDPDRNATALRTWLVDRVALPAANLHLMPVLQPDLDAAARAYGRALPVLDLVHLGIGDDGHTASWPPGDPVLGITDRDVAVVGPFNGRVRLTITPPVVDRCRRVLFLVVGAAKCHPLARVLAHDESAPASRALRADAVVHCDAAAAGDRR